MNKINLSSIDIFSIFKSDRFISFTKSEIILGFIYTVFDFRMKNHTLRVQDFL